MADPPIPLPTFFDATMREPYLGSFPGLVA